MDLLLGLVNNVSDFIFVALRSYLCDIHKFELFVSMTLLSLVMIRNKKRA